MDQTPENEKTTLVVPMVDSEIVTHLRALYALGWGKERIARELGISINSVQRYLRDGVAAETQTRPGAWTLDAAQQATARSLLDGPAAGNGVVVQRLLAEQQIDVPLRTLQRVLAPHRQDKRAAELATVRFETAPASDADRLRRKVDRDRRRSHESAFSSRCSATRGGSTCARR
jgi:transcriptional regulator with XRE-family HTH domain